MTMLDARRSEITEKLDRLRARMAAHQLDAVTLTQIPNLAWITAGASVYVNEATDLGTATIVVTPDRASVFTDPIEAPRLENEESLADLGFVIEIEPWYARGGMLSRMAANLRVGHDGAGTGRDLSDDLRDLRTHLQPGEIARYGEVGRLAGQAMHDALADVRPGLTEHAVAARMAAASRALGGSPIVLLVAADERVAQYRHPLPTDATIQRYVMAVLCLRKYGLVASITRLLHFGSLPADLRAKAEAVARVDARMILGTQPGRTLGDMFALAKEAYAAEGYPEAIEEHHQGGSAGYQSREVLARPGAPTPITVGQAFAWNPSVRGVKSEDTILLGSNGPAILTAIPGWPTWPVTIDGQTIDRPAIKEV
jgi:Xaa-Pro aminopeptidase